MTTKRLTSKPLPPRQKHSSRPTASRALPLRSAAKGEFAGGPTTFKIEGVFQLLDGVEVTLLSPQTINAQNKKHTFDLPATLNKYQHEAYKTACSGLMKK